MKNKLSFILICLSLIFIANLFAQGPGPEVDRGVWVSVFTNKKVLYSKAAVDELLNVCAQARINQIYIQLYQSGKAFYNSKISDRAKYSDMLRSFGSDPIDYLLQEAANRNIQVFAWVNMLSLGNNSSADIIKKLGPEVLTRDQYGRPSGRKDPNETDKYYLREEHLFLEPGDQRVVKYLTAITEEIVTRYPSLSGVHLDYVRYPMTVPFVPGSRFGKFGLQYGYGRENVASFKVWSGLDPLTGLGKDEYFSLWDDWRRQQVTALVRKISKWVKEKSPNMKLSSAVIPSDERAYSSMFQDWPLWLEEGVVDYVVLMNYTLDNQLSKELVRSALAHRQQGKVYTGLGLFMMSKNPKAFQEQFNTLNSLKPDGIVFFAYDDLAPAVVSYLGAH
ncbi:MAG: family 10 glycosylhydrolase [Candidatus Omnitrophica bacterium]|nr:family 10 glycosylhydrolase [Candidatus Omnitrophota bacterium]